MGIGCASSRIACGCDRHRQIRALTAVITALARGYALEVQYANAEGRVDFGKGEMIALELRVRGYLRPILQDCPLSADQQEADEPDGSDFALRVTATVPSTGQLLRWLLGAGDKLEVLAPADLRHTVAVQAAKMAKLYDAERVCAEAVNSAQRASCRGTTAVTESVEASENAAWDDGGLDKRWFRIPGVSLGRTVHTRPGC